MLYRFTASLIELLLEPPSALSAFVKSLTGFTIKPDALDLEELEPSLLNYTLGRIKDYGLVGAVDWLFSKTQERVYNSFSTHYFSEIPL